MRWLLSCNTNGKVYIRISNQSILWQSFEIYLTRTYVSTTWFHACLDMHLHGCFFIVLLNIPVRLKLCPLDTKLSVISPKTTHMRGNATPWAAEHSRPISISSTSRQVAYRNCIRINMRVKHVTAVLRAYHCMLYH